MSKDITSLDILAEAHLPSDLMTPSLGSNYGMDGYPDMQYGMGVLDAVIDQDLQPSPAFPTGVQRGASVEAMDLSGVMNENLADLDWLDPSQLPDLGRLPETPESIPELVDAWGVNRRTDGINVASHQTDLAYLRGTSNLVSSKKKATARTIEKVVTHAMRRSIEGQHISRVVKEAAESVGYEMERVVPLLRRVAEDHGLAGKVFIRASAYPGWGTGKWKKHAKKHAKEARYIIVSKRDKEQAIWIQNGRCAFTGKLAVTEIPWKKAYSYYAPRLEATGRKLANSDFREALKSAFLTSKSQRVARGESLQVQVMPGDNLGIEEAREAFSKSSPSKRETVEVSTEYLNNRISTWKKARLLEDHHIQSVMGMKGSNNEKLAAAVKIATAVKSSNFSGGFNRGEDAAQERFDRIVESKRARVSARSEKVNKIASDKRAEKVKSCVEEVVRYINKGARGETLKNIIATSIPREYAEDATSLLLPILKKTGALRESRREAAVYSGTEFRASQSTKEEVRLSPRNSAIAKAAKLGGCSVVEIKGMLKTVKKAMSEGLAGKDLDQYLSNRFSNRLIESAKNLVSEEREKHEGLAGFVYVEASAYASPSGTKGCDSGGLKHRANQIPSVRKMARCSSCTMARGMADGTMKCGAYNKILVSSKDLAGDDTAKIKRANIKSSNMTDAEATASLFAPSYDPSEFGLSNTNLEDVNFSSVENQKMAEVVFGDWEIGF